jgi:uracil phosphoribosyltransferase
MFILTDKNTLANTYIAELRDVEIQKDPLRFRRNIERLGEIMAYEISKELDYSTKNIKTPLGITKTDKKSIDAIRSFCSVPLITDDSAHRAEHSIEIDLLILHSLFNSTLGKIQII